MTPQINSTVGQATALGAVHDHGTHQQRADVVAGGEGERDGSDDRDRGGADGADHGQQAGDGEHHPGEGLDAEPVEQLVERRRRLPDVLEAREAMETKLAELAAERREATDLEAMHAALDLMAREGEQGGHGAEGDRLFHAAVTAAAHSTLLAEFMRSIAEQITESRNESLRQPGRPQRSLNQHRAILDATGEQRGRAAAAAMRRHVRTVAKVRLMDWDPATS